MWQLIKDNAIALFVAVLCGLFFTLTFSYYNNGLSIGFEADSSEDSYLHHRYQVCPKSISRPSTSIPGPVSGCEVTYTGFGLPFAYIYGVSGCTGADGCDSRDYTRGLYEFTPGPSEHFSLLGFSLNFIILSGVSYFVVQRIMSIKEEVS